MIMGNVKTMLPSGSSASLRFDETLSEVEYPYTPDPILTAINQAPG